jgi:HCOMODA/2-hydroxy-3-carboxy-muconic semialdehyde decarboxylase
MGGRVTAVIDDLVRANRILAAEGIVDGFGHISARHPERQHRFLIASVRAPELVEADDILEIDFDGAPAAPTSRRLSLERLLHAAVFRLRPDVGAVCHHHAPAVLPFCVTGVPLVPVVHLGATMGAMVPFWDPRVEFGDTDLLVRTPEQALSMAHALGGNWTILLRNHGATVAGRTIRECVFRAIYGAHNAAVQLSAMSLGAVRPLSAGEARAAGDLNLTATAVDRSWERWCHRAALLPRPSDAED